MRIVAILIRTTILKRLLVRGVKYEDPYLGRFVNFELIDMIYRIRLKLTLFPHNLMCVSVCGVWVELV